MLTLEHINIKQDVEHISTFVHLPLGSLLYVGTLACVHILHASPLRQFACS